MTDEAKAAAGDWITLEEAAQISGRSVRSIRRYIAQKKLESMAQHAPSADPGGGSTMRRMVKREEIIAVTRPGYALARLKDRTDTIVRHDRDLSDLSALVRGAVRHQRRMAVTISVVSGCAILAAVVALVGLNLTRRGMTKHRAEMSASVRALEEAREGHSRDLLAIRAELAEVKEALRPASPPPPAPEPAPSPPQARPWWRPW